MKIIYDIRITNKGNKNSDEKKSIWNSLFHLTTFIIKERLIVAVIIYVSHLILKFHGWDIVHWLSSLIEL